MLFLYFLFGLLFGIILSKFLIQKLNEKGSEKVINAAEYQDPFYVEVKTGKYFFMSALLKIYGRHGLFKLLADGTFMNEEFYLRKQNEKKRKNERHGGTTLQDSKEL
jgi:hypothetical protein